MCPTTIETLTARQPLQFQCLPRLLWSLMLCLAPLVASGQGAYDARTQALGSTGVALGDLTNAHFYNPALLAFHKGSADHTRDGMIGFQLTLNRLSDGVHTVAQAWDRDLEGQLTDAIERLDGQNATPENARNGVAAAEALRNAMRKLQHQPIAADAYTGLSISLPDDREGGAFFIGTRVLGRGLAAIEDDDLALLDRYLETMAHIAAGGVWEDAPYREELWNDGKLNNPSDRIASEAKGSILLVSELGVAGAKQWQVRGRTLALGLTPKIVRLQAHSQRWQANDNAVENPSSRQSTHYVNLDLGAALDLTPRLRLGLTVKDLRSRRFTVDDINTDPDADPDSTRSETLTLATQSHLGLAYLGPRLRAGLDLDLYATRDIYRQHRQQYGSLGLEYRVLNATFLRAGHRRNWQLSQDSETSVGLGWRWGRLVVDAAYVSGHQSQGGALQLGWMH